jgi:hypothetical protein
MGIASEGFDKQFAAQLACLRADAAVAGVVDGTFVHDLLGVAFQLLPSWIVRDLQEVARTAEGRLLSSHEDDVNEAFRMLTDEFLPIVTISAPTLDDPSARLGPHEISPVIVLHLDEVLADASVPFDLADHVATDLAHFHAYVEDYRLTAGPELTTLGGCEAVHFTAAYTFLHADAVEGCPAREEAYYVCHHGAVLALRLCDFPDRDQRLAVDFGPFIQSVSFR